jgi:hypothetical protein
MQRINFMAAGHWSLVAGICQQPAATANRRNTALRLYFFVLLDTVFVVGILASGQCQ